MKPSKELNNMLTFPEPDNHAFQHSQDVYQALVEFIDKQGGVIRFDQYMSFVLYEPRFGYYSCGNQKFGKDGDFITAPELSPLFSRCLANQCQSVLSGFKSPVILELGAGSGILACEMLRHLERLDGLPERYLILELSGELRERQQSLLNDQLPHLIKNISWLDKLPEESFTGIVIGNEVIDALPVRRFTISNNSIHELGVSLDNNGITWELIEADDELLAAVNQILNHCEDELEAGYTSEVNLQLEPWLAALSDCLSEGVLLFIDYGYPSKEYYHPQRVNGTLICHYRHRVHDDPFLYPGIQDISASVNFTALAEAAVDSGLDVSGYTSQAYFLMANGLEQEMRVFDYNDSQTRTEISRQAQQLTLPGNMGERFKVMALTRNFEIVLQEFSIRDQRVLL